MAHTLQRPIERATKGDTRAFQELFELLVERLFAYAFSHTKEEHSAEDIVQETLVELWDALPSFSYEGDPQFYKYVYTILKRKIMWYRSDRSRQSLVELTEEHEHLLSETPVYEDYRHLGSLIDRLSETYREILRLRYWASLSFAEIAATLDINENAAKVRHHRALKQLQGLLSTHEQRSY